MAIDISSTTRRIVYTGSSGVGPYSFAFEVLAQTDIAVYFNTTELTLTTDYTVSISGDGTGSVTIVVGTNVPSTPTASDRITIVGDRTIARTTDFTTGGPLFATSLNDEFDSQTIFVQQVLEQSDRSLRAPNTDPTTIDMTLPLNTVRANKTLAFDADGNPTTGEIVGNWRGDWAASTDYNKRDLIKDTTNNNVYICTVAHTSSGAEPISTNTDAAKWDLMVDAASATSSATAAASSASAAATSESNAATSESNAATSATTATTKASEASTSATNAATSASSASTSASSASTSASTATTKASEASTSATNAATSETNAASSASTASSAATTATTQASNANTSATNAATSETNAASSASTASTAATNAATSASAAATSATAAQTAAESIDAFYLGAQASDPTVDLNGDPVTAGDWYFNTGSNETRIYNGSTWQVTAISTSGFLTSGDIGSTVQAYDADTAKYDDATANFTGNLQKSGANVLTGNETVTLSGDVTGSGTTAITTTLGTVAVSKGGTGQTTYTDGELLIGNTTGNTLTKATLTAGSGISVTNGSGAITIASTGGGGFTNMETFTSSGTWTNPGTVTRVKVTVIGGGGGGGISFYPNPINGLVYVSGGAGGGTAIETLTIPTAPVSITVGGGGAGMQLPQPNTANFAASGGTSSFGAFCSATGGAGGLGGQSSNFLPSPSFHHQSAGGVGIGGTININGEPTVSDSYNHASSGAAIFGGRVSWFLLPGSPPSAPAAPAVWADAVVYGAGGGATSTDTPSPIWRAGNGMSGVVIVEY